MKTLEQLSDVSGLVEALEYLIKDIKRKPNDTRYATAIKKAQDALAQYPTLTAPADKEGEQIIQKILRRTYSMDITQIPLY